MTTGHWIMIFLLCSLVTFAIWDVVAFKSGRTTMSRIIIQASYKHKWARILALIFVGGVISVGFWLVPHLCLPQVFLNLFHGYWGCL